MLLVSRLGLYLMTIGIFDKTRRGLMLPVGKFAGLPIKSVASSPLCMNIRPENSK
jgi:hypothetical protein